MGFNLFPDDVVALDLREYNGFNQIVSVRRDNVQSSYAYRPDGLRQSKTVEGVVTTHYWDGSNIIAEANTSGNLKARYLRGINLIAQQIDQNLYYYTHNAHGDIVQRIRDNGEAAPVYEYDAFGNQKNTVETDPNPFRYCAELYDTETESYYLRARSFAPSTGRFTSEDSIRSFSNKMYNGQEITDPLSLNLYTYAYNDPINYVDPSGHFSFLQAIAGAAAIVAGVAMASIAIAAAPVVVGIAALMAAGAFAAGMMTVMFGANEIAESVTGINHMRYAATGGNASLDQEYYAVMSAVGMTGASMAQGIAPYAQAAQIANTPQRRETVRVGQWMSKKEYEEFKKTGIIPRSNVLMNGKEGYMKQASYGDYYVEFDMDKSLLLEKDSNLGWYLVKSKNPYWVRLSEERGERLVYPYGRNLEHIYTKEK